MSIDLRERFKGMFWGLVTGDCLGSPIQFTEKDQHPYISEMVFSPGFSTPPGYWTDDSSLAFCIAESFVQLGHYDLKHIAGFFVEWYVEGFWSSLPYAFDIGHATASACRRIKAAGSLKNGREEDQGNGSIMRMAPACIMNYGNPDDAMLHEISDLTHNSSVVRQVVSKMNRILNDHLAGIKTNIQSPYSSRHEVNNSGWAVSTLEAALWAFQASTSFEEGMLLAVNLGGDSDSIGAVYGQIAGAYYGYDSIPERWLEKIKDRQDIDSLIQRLIDLKLGK